MAVKRGVSLYSYQQAYYTGKLDLEGCVRTAVETTGAKGIELIYEQMPIDRYPDAIYPEITDRGVSYWKDLMAKYGTVPVCMDSFIDSMIYKGRISYVQEQVQMMEQDLALASRLGFSCIRVLALVAPEVLEQALPAAEYYGVAMGLEVHPPHALNGKWMLNVAELARKHGTDKIGLIPDFGIFMTGLNGAQLHAARVTGEKEDVLAYVTEAVKNKENFGKIIARAREMGAGSRIMGALNNAAMMNRYGYICSEFEGQRAYHGQDCPYEEDEIEQVRRHHEMLKRYIGE